MKPTHHEYAFDVKLFAVVRVVAPSKQQAIEAMARVIDCASPSADWLGGFNDTYSKEHDATVRITELSYSGARDEAENVEPFEIDGSWV